MENSPSRARRPGVPFALTLGLLAALAASCHGDDPAGPPTASSRQPNTGGCALPSLTCDGICRDLTADRAHCGACDRACAASEVCSRGVCAASCGLGLTRCATDGSCHELRSDPAHCGACGHACGFGEVCDQGVCAPSCAPHLTDCGSGACRDVMTDPYSCGACGRVCRAGEVCTSGACALPAVCALGTASSTAAVVDQAELVSSTTIAARVGLTAATGAGQRFTVGRTGFLSGVEVSLTTCGGALLAGSTVQLAVLDDRDQTLATATLPSTAVTNGSCPRFPPSLTLAARGRAIFDLGASCVPVTAGRRLRFVVTATGATTTGTCPTSTRRCSNAPTVACTTAAQCTNLPAIVSAGMNPLSTYAGGAHTLGDADVPGAALTFKTHVTPFVTWCAGATSCSGTCRDLTTDRNHCGACGRTCALSTVCSGGTCQTACGAGLSTCTRGGVAYCANLQSDNVNCGACGVACAPGQVCAAGGCVATCGVGMTTCGRGATAYCANPASDNANCGRCGNVCPAGLACSNGVCAASCAAPTARCGAACVDTRYDPAHCGACGNACPAGEVCSAGVCGRACGVGLTACGVGALARCADLQNDPTSCGACGRACPAGQLCAAGACGVACGADSVRCDLGAGPYCAAPLADNANCGGCGVRCGAGNACIDGACAVTCGPEQGSCSGRCVDLLHDPANCGDCGRACAAGQYCTMGACATACAAPDTRCGGRCVDLRSNPDHCGACGSVCPPAGAEAIRACGDATCGSFCNPGRGDCDGAAANGCETDLRVTAAHCGLCGRACALPHASSGCAMGACRVTTCEAGWVDCNGDPSDGCELQEGGACAPTAPCAVGALRCYEGQRFCEPVLVAPAGQACRAAAGPCDVAEACDGMSPLCPSDRVVPGTSCPSGLSGSGTATASECLATYTFRVVEGETYTISTCDAFTGDPLVRVTGACRCDNDDACGLGARCTCVAESSGEATICASSYPGVASSWSYTVTSASGRCGAPTVCRPGARACDAAEQCDGLGAACPDDGAEPDGARCEDGNACTENDRCQAGACTSGAAVSCAEGQCQGATCDPSTGRCIAKSDGTTCDDGDVSTRDDLCFGGLCRGAPTSNVNWIVAGMGNSFALTEDGRIYTFGQDQQSTDRTALQRLRTPTPVAGVDQVREAAAGPTHTLVVRNDGTVRAWGGNDWGQLGDGTTTPRPTPVTPPIADTVSHVAAGLRFSLALTTSGALWAWGGNQYGELGDGGASTQLLPVRVTVPFSPTRIAAGHHHALALATDGTVWAWGENTSGQLGDGTTTNRANPVRVAGLPAIAQIAAGGFHSLALATDGSVWAWGNNTVGQLGDGTTTNRSTPVRVGAISEGYSIAAGFAHSVVVHADRTLWGWGDTTEGQLASGGAAPPGFYDFRTTPARIGSLSGVGLVAAGGFHTLAQTWDGRVWSFGSNAVGQLGDDTLARARPRVDTVVGFGRYAVNVLTQRNDTLRTGANLRETALTAANVNQSTFGRLFDMPVQGDVLAQPLYVQGVIDGHDVLYVVTLDNWVYAFDAQDGSVYWSRQVGQPLLRTRYYWCGDLRGNVGIVSTPVVDLSRHALYFTAKSVPAHAAGAPEPMPEYHLHAVDLVTGAERPGSPVRIEASVAGDARIARRTDTTPPEDPWFTDARASTGNAMGRVVFDATYQMQRPALLLQDGQVHITFGGHCDLTPYHGWLISYDAESLAQTGAMVTTPTGSPAPRLGCGTVRWDNVPMTSGEATGTLNNGIVDGYGQGGGIWQYGNGPASTGSGDLYFAMGNSMGVVDPMDIRACFPGGPSSSSLSFSNAVLRVGRRADGSLGVRSWFQPADYSTRDTADDDLGSAGPMLIPGTDRLLVGGKRGSLFVLRRDALGGFCADNAGAASIYAPTDGNAVGDLFGGTTWWASPAGARFYLWTAGHNLRAYTLAGDTVLPADEDPSGSFGVNRSTVSLSAEGSRAGSGVLWAFAPSCAGRSALFAYNAENLAAGPIYSSALATIDQLPVPDPSNPVVRSSVITVAAGRVYVGTQDNRVAVFGLLSSPRPAISTPPASACASSCPPSAGAYTGPGPTWNDLYTRFFGPGTEGQCQSCHTHNHGFGSTAADLYNGLRARGLINPTATASASPIINPTLSILRWVNPTGGRMPQMDPRPPLLCNPAAVDALQRWINAGASGP